MPMMIEHRKFPGLTIPEAARRLHRAPSTIWLYIRKRKLRAIRYGGRTRAGVTLIPESSIRSFPGYDRCGAPDGNRNNPHGLGGHGRKRAATP